MLCAARSAVGKVVGPSAAPAVVTLSFVLMWYGLNVAFNLLNKTIFNYFPFPYTVSAVHVVVGLAYCVLTYLLGAKKASFGRARPAALPLGRSQGCVLLEGCSTTRALCKGSGVGKALEQQCCASTKEWV